MQRTIVFLVAACIVAVSCQVTTTPRAYLMTLTMPTVYGPFNGTTTSYHIAIDHNNIRYSQFGFVAGLGVIQNILLGNVNYMVFRQSDSVTDYKCFKYSVSEQTANQMVETADILQTILTNGTFVGTAFVECPQDKVPINANTYSFAASQTESLTLFTGSADNQPKYLFQTVVSPFTGTIMISITVQDYKETVSDSDFKLLVIDPSTCQEFGEYDSSIPSFGFIPFAAKH